MLLTCPICLKPGFLFIVKPINDDKKTGPRLQYDQKYYIKRIKGIIKDIKVIL